MTDFEKNFLALLIINASEDFANDYRLIRILDKFLAPADIAGITARIRANEYVTYTYERGVHYYTISEKGNTLLVENLEIELNKLLMAYPEQTELLTGMGFHVNF